jgi:hypothetical protein
MAVLAFLGFNKVPPENKDFFNMGLVALIGFVGTSFGYYLGSSQGSFQKNGILAQVAAGQTDANPPPPPFVKVASEEAGFARLSLLYILSILLILGLLSGCASMRQEPPQGLATKSLLSMQQTIVAGARIGDGFCKQRILNPEQCTKLRDYYFKAGPAYDFATDSLITAIKLGSTAGDLARYQTAQKQFITLFGDFMGMAVDFNLIPALEGGTP